MTLTYEEIVADPDGVALPIPLADHMICWITRTMKSMLFLRWFLIITLSFVAVLNMVGHGWAQLVEDFAIVSSYLLQTAFIPEEPPKRKIKLPALKLAWTPAMIPIPIRS